ncbi:MAG TPA: replication-associated recombination protein A [bacterium]|nr:replication-associated recombination protein A [bacterium]
MSGRKKENDLFLSQLEDKLDQVKSLAARMRPDSISDFVGQEHLLGADRPLRKIIDKGILASLVFWGPPGTGKTTLARIIANNVNAHFEEYSAVTSRTEDIRRVVSQSEERLSGFEKRTIIFVDEFHRFNKAQQDAFLPHLESGLLTLIGATTENPYFVLNPALRSRISIFNFKRLGDDALDILIERAIGSLSSISAFPEDAKEELRLISGGDARVVLNLLELVAQLADEGIITRELIRETASRKQLDYQRLGTSRFDMVSAFIKSMRGSNPDAALYWLARLLEGGEQPEFIARRMVIFSAEDIGCAAPQAITVATATADAVAFVGMPEARIPLASCCVYLATCPKSNAAYMALGRAMKDVVEKPLGPVPLHLRNQDYTGEKTARDGYKYPHDFPGHHVRQAYFPENLDGSIYYDPSDQGNEANIMKRLEKWRADSGDKKKKNPDS